jgi:hypothetical protein
MCQACGEQTLGIEHPLGLCKSEVMIEARDHWWAKVEYEIAKAPLHLQQALYIVEKHIRNDDGGEVACCGTFQPHFVNNLPYHDAPITEQETKFIIKILKGIAAGCRVLLRIAAETQLGQLGINLQQRSVTQFFKTIKEPLRKELSTRGTTSGIEKNKTKELNKNKKRNAIYLNKNLPSNVISHTNYSIDNDVFYWEFKAG